MTSAASDATVCEIRGKAAWLTLNRPASRNALSAELTTSLYHKILDAIANPGVRAIVLTGAGPAFCAGADLKGQSGFVGQSTPRTLPDVLKLMLECPKPIVAAINGPAYAGGLGLVAAADIVIAVDSAAMSFSEVRIGVIPAVISVVCIPKLGVHHAMRLFLTGERFTGRDAVAMGLVHRAVPAADLEQAVNDQVAMIVLGGPHAVQEAKRLVRRVPHLSTAEGFAETTPWSARLFQSREGVEGIAAFRERRAPVWVNERSEP